MFKLRAGVRTSQIFSLLMGLLFTATVVTAQVTTGNLQGVVLDPNKQVVAGATVKVTNTETGVVKETTTNDEGFYRLTNLPPGEKYTIEIVSAGFTGKLENVVIRIGTENNADVGVGLASVSGGEVTVTADEAPLINPTQNQLSQTYTTRQLTQLPYVGSIDNLALLTPGVTTPPTGFAFTNGVEFSANGNRTRSNNFQIDGQDNNDNSVAGPTLGFQNSEAIGEYQIITNNFSAEFGRNSGAQINTVTKAGTNEFHGSLFEFHRNSALDTPNNVDKRSAATFKFLEQNGFTQFAGFSDRFQPSPFRDNRFGGSLGGPIVKNKVFFFATYQRELYRSDVEVDTLGGGSYTVAPASAQFAAARFGTASANNLIGTCTGCGPFFAQGQGTLLLVPPVEDSNGDGVPDAFVFGPGGSSGIITPGYLAPLAVTTTTAGGTARTTIFGGEVVRLRRNDNTQGQFIGRVDYNLTQRDTLVGRFIDDRNQFPLQAGGSSAAGSRFDYRDRTRNLGITYTRTISNRLVNEARFNYSNLFVAFGDVNDTANIGPLVTFTANAQASLASLSFGEGYLSGLGDTSAALPQDRTVKTYQIQDTVSATLGNHALKTGIDFRRQNLNTYFLPNILGNYTFSGSTSATTAGSITGQGFFTYGTNGTNGVARTGTATAIENYLLGRPRSITFSLGEPRIITHQNDYFAFVQDDWRVRPNLTLNLGLRYEISTTPFNPLIEKLNQRETSGTSIFPAGFDIANRTATPLPLDKNNFAPRVGFAWQPNFHFLGDRFTNGRTVIRGGFGIAYDPSFFNIVLNTVTNGPFVATGTIRQTPGGTGSVTFPFHPTNAAQVAGTPGTNGGDPRLFNRVQVDNKFHNPYSESWNFGIQQELYHNGVLEARYVGTRTVGQFQNMNANPDLRYLNAAGTYLGLGAGAFTNGVVVSTTAGAGTNGLGRLNPNFGIIQRRINGAQSTYHGLQMRFDTRLANSLTLNANYTFSKTLDNASEIFSTLQGGQTVSIAQNPFDITEGERGLSAFHQKHTFTANFLYELPFMRDQKGFAGKLLGGYQLNGIVRMGSGRPYTPLNFYGRYDPSFTGSLRPFNGNPNAPASTIAFSELADAFLFGVGAGPGQWVIFDTSQPGSQGRIVNSLAEAQQQARIIYNDFGLAGTFFADPSLIGGAFGLTNTLDVFKTPYGNVGRNSFLGLPFYQFDMSVFKTTRISERLRLEFRAEAFNLLNHRNYGVADPITEDAFFGSFVGTYNNPGLSNTGSSRTYRFGLRLLF